MSFLTHLSLKYPGLKKDDRKTHSKLTVCIMNNFIVSEQFQSVTGHQFDSFKSESLFKF